MHPGGNDQADQMPWLLPEPQPTTDARTIQPQWPHGKCCAASLTLHVDAQSVWVAFGQNNPMSLSLGEYGPRVGVWRILDLLAKYGLKASFFIPAWTAKTYPDVARACAEAGHEIGYHGYTHTRADAGWTGSGWDRHQEAETLDRSLEILERLTGQRTLGHCFEHSPNTIELLLERGFLYSNSHQADDVPYWWFRNGQSTRLLELPFDWIMSDSTQYMHVRAPWSGQPRSPDVAYETWRAEFDGIREYGRYFLLTNHPEWTGRGSRILALERLIQYILGHGDVWWATTLEVAEYWHRSYPPQL